MNRADINTVKMSVLERQQWQQQQIPTLFKHANLNVAQFDDNPINEESFIRHLAYQSMKTDPGLEIGLPSFGVPEPMGFVNDVNSSISRTFSCPPVVNLTEKLVSTVKKRKPDKSVEAEEANKKIKGELEDEQSNNNGKQSRETSCENTGKEKPKLEVQKQDYIHVRARRGQATDSHSLAERVRREKISERMRYLQDLVPGCNKIIGKAGMLDEIINYVQSLQRQVEFLSMKLAAVNPNIDANIESLFTKEIFQSCADSYTTVGMSPEVVNPPYYSFNPVQQVVSCGGLNSSQIPLERTSSVPAPVSLPEQLLDSSCFTQQAQPPAWENDLQNLYNIGLHQGRSSGFQSEAFTGDLPASNLKMEL